MSVSGTASLTGTSKGVVVHRDNVGNVLALTSGPGVPPDARYTVNTHGPNVTEIAAEIAVTNFLGSNSGALFVVTGDGIQQTLDQNAINEGSEFTFVVGNDTVKTFEIECDSDTMKFLGLGATTADDDGFCTLTNAKPGDYIKIRDYKLHSSGAQLGFIIQECRGNWAVNNATGL